VIERYALAGTVAIGRDFAADEVTAFGQRFGGAGLAIIGDSDAIDQVNVARQLDAIRVGDVRDVAGLVRAASHRGFEAANWIVAIGGGATIDVAKLLRVRAANGQNPFAACSAHDDVDKTLSGGAVRWLPLLALPSVLGAGAEISALSDVLRTHDGVRVPFIHERLPPTAAAIDLEIAQTAPAHVAASSAFDALIHLLDPWLGSLPSHAMQWATSESVARELVDHVSATGVDDGADSSLARLSHLAITPGLARVGGHASCIHRIEHAVPTGTFKTHGEGLVYVAIRLLRWAERWRSDELREWSRALCRIFGRSARPSLLLEDFATTLGLDPHAATLDAATLDATVDGVASHFCVNGCLPGTLGITPSEVRSILQPDASTRPSTRPILDETPPFGPRVFGRECPADLVRCVLTPIPAIATAFEGADESSQAWFPTRLLQAKTGTVLVVQTTPGASAAKACLDLLGSWLPYPVPITFLGLAGALTDSFVAGSWTFARPEAEEHGGSPPGRWPTIHSFESLGTESEAYFEYLRWIGVDLVDLEVATVSAWCARRNLTLEVAVVVSDHPGFGRPIWALPASGPGSIDLGDASRTMVDKLGSHFWAEG
jgi:alcohol dehydrogenase class IV